MWLARLRLLRCGRVGAGALLIGELVMSDLRRNIADGVSDVLTIE